MRRSFLLGGTAALVTLCIPGRGEASAARRIALRHAGSGARFDGPWHNGRAADPGAMRELTLVLADPGATPPLPFDAGAVEIAWEVMTRTRLQGPLDIHSGYRSPQVNRAVHGAGDSQHLRAMALDIGVAAGRLPAVVETAVALARGGVGIYRARGFVHLDSGPVRNWSDSGYAAASPRDRMLSRIAGAWNSGRRPMRIDTRLPTGW
jgi:uncharacterized protein YcbK (DUF882 family)